MAEEAKSEKSTNSHSHTSHKTQSLLSDDAEQSEESHSESLSAMSQNEGIESSFQLIRQKSIKSLLSQLVPKTHPLSESWTPLETHKLMSHILLILSVLIFVWYKFFWKNVMTNLPANGLLNFMKTLRPEGDKKFILSIDVDGPKLAIFLNTILMNNFSISKKLSHNDAYIS